MISSWSDPLEAELAAELHQVRGRTQLSSGYDPRKQLGLRQSVAVPAHPVILGLEDQRAGEPVVQGESPFLVVLQRGSGRRIHTVEDVLEVIVLHGHLPVRGQ